MEITKGVFRAGWTIAEFRNGAVGLNVFFVIQIYIPHPISGKTLRLGECVNPRMARIPGGHGAIKNLETKLISPQNVLRVTNPQGMHGVFGRDEPTGELEDILQQVTLTIQRPTPKPVPFESNLEQRFSTFAAQLWQTAPLDDCEYFGLVFRERSSSLPSVSHIPLCSVLPRQRCDGRSSFDPPTAHPRGCSHPGR